MTEKQKNKILVIDDDRDICDLISHALEAKGFEVIVVSDPAEAVEEAMETGPDLIFISLVLSGYNGLKICRSIHAVERLKKAPIILLITRPGEIDPEHVALIGVADVLVKPFNTDKLVSETMNMLGLETVSPERDEQLLRTLVEEELGTLPAREDPDTITAEEERKTRDKRVSPEQSKDDTIEPWDNAVREPVHVRGEEEQKSAFGGIKNLTEKFPVFYVVAVLAVFGIGVLFFTGTGKKLLEILFKGTSVKKESVQKDIPAVRNLRQKKETEKIPPFSGVDTSKKTAAPVTGAEKTESVPSTSTPAEQPKILKKKLYSIHVGVFGKKKNAVLLADKLKKKGYDAYVRKESRVNKKPIYRVLIGRFDKRSKSLGQSKVILQNEGLESFVYTIEPVN